MNGVVVGGSLRVDWSYGDAVHDRGTVEALARGFERALRGLVDHCRRGAWGYTPSDFPLAGLDQEGLDRVVGGRREVEEIYPLTPLQQGLLFHSVKSPESGLYFEQARVELEGRLEPAVLRRAWAEVAERHAALRTRFAWRGLDRPLQVVERGAALPWEEKDLRGLSAEEQRCQIDEFLDRDRKQGFDFRTVPLARATLFRTRDNPRLIELLLLGLTRALGEP